MWWAESVGWQDLVLGILSVLHGLNALCCPSDRQAFLDYLVPQVGFCFVEEWACCVSKACLELLSSSNPPASTSKVGVAGSIGLGVHVCMCECGPHLAHSSP